jgi:hypothetical protein
LLYRRPSSHPVPDPLTDAGEVILPKLFRRLSTWEVNRFAKMVQGSFRTYLQDHPDAVTLTDEFLDQGEASAIHNLHDFVQPDGFFELWPEDLVFRESPSRLIGPGGAPVDW